ncbi:MAG: hypothetical protein QM831_17180 [Kofleriaceae bacterium]
MGGISIPVGDDNWTNTADTSPKLHAAVGAVGSQGLGGAISADWTPVNLNADGGSFGNLGSVDIAAHRFRFLANLVFQHPIAKTSLVFSARIGVGLDLAHASATATVLGNTTSTSDTNAGFGFELGGGLWYSLGDIQVGGELALPVASHSKHGDNTDGNYTFDYTSYDIDLLLGVRLFSR